MPANNNFRSSNRIADRTRNSGLIQVINAAAKGKKIGNRQQEAANKLFGQFSSEQQSILTEIAGARQGIDSASRQQSEVVRPETGGSFRSGLGAANQEIQRNQNVLRDALERLSSAPGRKQRQGSGAGFRQRDRGRDPLLETSNLVDFAGGLVDSGVRFGDRAITQNDRRATGRASFVSNVAASQRNTIALNRLIQSGQRKTRGAGVALPRRFNLGDERRRSLLL